MGGGERAERAGRHVDTRSGAFGPALGSARARSAPRNGRGKDKRRGGEAAGKLSAGPEQHCRFPALLPGLTVGAGSSDSVDVGPDRSVAAKCSVFFVLCQFRVENFSCVTSLWLRRKSLG